MLDPVPDQVRNLVSIFMLSVFPVASNPSELLSRALCNVVFAQCGKHSIDPQASRNQYVYALEFHGIVHMLV